MDPNSPQWPPDLPLIVRFLIVVRGIVSDLSRRSDGTVNRCLLDLFDPKTPASAEPKDGVSSTDTTIEESRHRKLWFRLFTPSSSSSSAPLRLPLIVYFHGGGFFNSEPNSFAFDALCRQLSKKVPAVVVSVSYRRTPEHRCPSPYEDGLDTLKFLDDNAAILPPAADLGRCFVAGDSAGGNIAHHVVVKSCKYKFSRLKIKGLVGIQPFYGGIDRTESEKALYRAPILNLDRTDWMWKAFLPVGSDRDHEASNVSGPNKIDISELDFPETLVVVGGYDPLKDRERSYCDWLRSCGKQVKSVFYPNAFHGFYGFPESQIPDTALLISEVRDFIEKCK